MKARAGARIPPCPRRALWAAQRARAGGGRPDGRLPRCDRLRPVRGPAAQSQRAAVECFYSPNQACYTSPSITTLHNILATLEPQTLDGMDVRGASKQTATIAPCWSPALCARLHLRRRPLPRAWARLAPQSRLPDQHGNFNHPRSAYRRLPTAYSRHPGPSPPTAAPSCPATWLRGTTPPMRLRCPAAPTGAASSAPAPSEQVRRPPTRCCTGRTRRDPHQSDESHRDKNVPRSIAMAR